MKITSTDVQLENGTLVVNGKKSFSELQERTEREEPVVRQRSLIAGLPDEDLTPGHVMPPVILTVSRAS